MEYTVVITKEPGAPWRAVVPVLPECEAEAETRDEVLTQIKERLTTTLRHTEVVRIEVPSASEANGSSGHTTSAEWPDFGIFRNDPTLGAMFDEIERQRDSRLAGE